MFCYDEDELEPRLTPKPASKLDCFTVPSVPEVSLIFDKPLSFKTTENTNFRSPAIKPKSLICKNNSSSSLNVNGSYAAWKEQNYSWKHPSSYTIPHHKEQSEQNYIIHSYLVEDNTINTSNKSKEKNDTSRTDIYNSSQSKEINRKNDDCFHKYNYEISENNVTHIERKQDTEYNEKRIDSMSAMSHINKPGINADNYIINENEYSPSLHKRKLITNNSKQKIPYNDSISESNIQNLSINPNKLQQSEFQLPHYLGQYPYFNMNSYSFPQLHPYSTHNTDNQETLKNLLQIINSQNEQIKSLQIQIDRLLKMQEENLREKKKCSCSFQSQEHDQLYANSNNILDVSNYVTVPENTKKNIYQKESLKDKRKDNYNENENINQNELILTDAQSKKTFMEKKVSIGVMTSFEFTVQNNPFTMDIENYEKKDSQQENFKMCNSVCLDTNESLRRYKNSFTRIPSAQLENIVEDSESYMSSSQQQNSNLNASTFTKDLEKQALDVQRETHIHRSESPKLCKDIATKLNETENKIKKHLKNSTEEEIDYKTIKTSMIQKNAENAENHIQKNRKFKENILTNMNQNKQNIRDNESIQTSNFVNKSSYCNDPQKEGQISRFKQINSIEDSLILNGDDLKINERPLTPEPSIHVEMNEYSSDDDSEHVKHSSKVGWTFYNNVIGRVNQLLQNSCIIDDQQQKQTKINQNERDEIENKTVLDTVKVATLEQLKKLGISLHENSEVKESNNSNKKAFDLSFYPRLDYQTNMTQTTSAINETNTSMHMKALALKYLTDEQLAELAVQRQSSSLQHLMVSNVQGTNMSFATMRYLERYQLLPGKNNIQVEDIGKNDGSPKVDLKITDSKSNLKTVQHFPFNQTPRTTCPSKILDISTLKRQPKLL